MSAPPPSTTSNKPRTIVVVKRPKRKRQRPTNQKPGIPNLSKELTEPPPPSSPTNAADDDLFDSAFLEDGDAIPCDTLLAFQSLAQSPDSCLTIPLRASYQHVPCILESQIYPLLQQGTNKTKKKQRQDADSEVLAMVTRELEELWHKNTLRRLTSIQHPNPNAQQASSRLSALVLTDDYRRGVWDAHDASDHQQSATGSTNIISSGRATADVQRLYVQWYLDHLHCWTGRLLTPFQLQETWNKDPPQNTLQYGIIVSLSKALEYLQKIQVVMPNHHTHNQQTTYQLWLPEWGQVLSALTTAEKKFIQKLQQTYHKELSEQSFLTKPYYNGISAKLLLQWMRDQGKIQVASKPFGNFIQLVVGAGNTQKKRKR